MLLLECSCLFCFACLLPLWLPFSLLSQSTANTSTSHHHITTSTHQHIHHIHHIHHIDFTSTSTPHYLTGYSRLDVPIPHSATPHPGQAITQDTGVQGTKNATRQTKDRHKRNRHTHRHRHQTQTADKQQTADKHKARANSFNATQHSHNAKRAFLRQSTPSQSRTATAAAAHSKDRALEINATERARTLERRQRFHLLHPCQRQQEQKQKERQRQRATEEERSKNDAGTAPQPLLGLCPSHPFFPFFHFSKAPVTIERHFPSKVRFLCSFVSLALCPCTLYLLPVLRLCIPICDTATSTALLQSALFCSKLIFIDCLSTVYQLSINSSASCFCSSLLQSTPSSSLPSALPSSTDSSPPSLPATRLQSPIQRDLSTRRLFSCLSVSSVYCYRLSTPHQSSPRPFASHRIDWT